MPTILLIYFNLVDYCHTPSNNELVSNVLIIMHEYVNMPNQMMELQFHTSNEKFLELTTFIVKHFH
jgi:hypothetical protein